MNLLQRFEDYSIKVAMSKGGKVLANLLASGTIAAWATAKSQPILTQYGPQLEKFGIHVTPEVFFVSICGFLATLINDAHGVTQQNKEIQGETK